MVASSIKVGNHHQIVIPQEARKRLGIKSGDRLLLDVQDGMIVLLPEPRSYTRSLAGLHRGIWEEAGNHILTEREAWNK